VFHALWDIMEKRRRFALLDAISSGMTLSHERWSSDMHFRQQITWCWLQKKSIIKSGCFEHFVCIVNTSSGKVDIASISMTWWVIDTLLPLCDFTQLMQRASSQSTHHLVAGQFSSILVHGSQLVFNDIPKGIKTNPHLIRMSMADWIGSNSGITKMTYDSNSEIQIMT
jgi:hypothetical protein